MQMQQRLKDLAAVRIFHPVIETTFYPLNKEDGDGEDADFPVGAL